MYIATILLLTSTAFIVVHGGGDEVAEIMEACMGELGLTPLTLKELMKHKTPEDVHKEGCYRACLMKTFGIMKDAILSEDVAHEVIERVHADDPIKVKHMKQSFKKCHPAIIGLTEECNLSNVMFDCFLAEMDRLQTEELPVNL